MSSSDPRKAALYQKLGAVTNSSAVNKTSILVGASRYIEDLKQQVEELNQEIGAASSSSSSSEDRLPMVKVETLEKKGFLINVFLEKNSPGLLVSILEVFEELSLDVLHARVSCADNFQLQAIGGDNGGPDGGIDAQVVKQAVLQAIRNGMDQDSEKDED